MAKKLTEDWTTDMTLNEIAKELDMSPQNALILQRKAIRHFKAKLKEKNIKFEDLLEGKDEKY